jgi:hypothetical protein
MQGDQFSNAFEKDEWLGRKVCEFARKHFSVFMDVWCVKDEN